MDPPSRQIRRRAVSDQHSQIASQRYIPDGSPSPFVPPTSETRRPRTSHTVSGVLDVGQDSVTRSTESLQILEECVETKTVTTTTTIQRAWPQFPIHRPQILETLDAKRYPLASKPTPYELTNFSYEVDGQTINFCGDDHQRYTDESSLSRSYPRPDAKVKESSNSAKHDTPNTTQTKKKRAQNNHGRSLRALSGAGARSPISGRSQQQNGSVLDRHAADEELVLNNERRPRHKRVNLHMSRSTLPATPDTSELDLPASGLRRSPVPSFANTQTPELSQNDSFDEFVAPSPSELLNDGSFPSAVTTPPIAESDLEPFEGVSAAFTQVSAQRPTLNTAAAQNASLPSPGLSPTFAATDLHSGHFPGGDHDFDEVDDLTEATQSGGSQETINERKIRTPRSRAVHADEDFENSSLLQQSHVPTVMDTRSMIDTFDSMPDNMKSFMMYQLLRRCSRKTLHVIADVVNPALKCDFLDQLPVELRLHILSFLDYKDLCRAAQVSKKWREVVNTNETGWKELLDRDGYVLPTGELERAIHQGWGWQDPYGLDGYEQDLSVQGGISGRAIATDSDLTILGSHKLENDNVRKVRSTTKRKRATGNSSSERAKRRAVGHEFAGKAHELLSKYPYTAYFHKSEGPLTAANAAALAVPDPKIGPPGFQQLHLFKSLYRRHSMLRRSWTNGKMEPYHLAFPAHPAHVITCLQFDDDKILTGSDDTLIHVYDTKTGQLRKKLEGHEGGVWALQYEGNVLVSGSTDRSVRVWDIEKGLCTQVFHGHTSTVRCLQILMPVDTGRIERGKPVMMPEKPLIITGSRDSQLRVWRLPEQGSKRYIQTGPPANDADCPYFVRVLNGHTHSVRAIAAHQDTLVSGSYDFTVRVWKISTGETIHRLQGHTMKVYSVVLDHKRNRCISGSMDNFVKIWSLESGSCLFTLEGHSSLVGLLDLRDDRLVSAAADSTLRIWDPENGQCKSTLSAHTGAITCFQHDGQKVISGSDRTLKMWNVKTGECIKDLLTDLSGVWQVKFDQRRCVAAVQRDSLTFVEVLDFGASRDGIPASQRGSRILLNNDVEINDRVVEEEDTLL